MVHRSSIAHTPNIASIILGHPVTILVTALSTPYYLTNGRLILNFFDNKQIISIVMRPFVWFIDIERENIFQCYKGI